MNYPLIFLFPGALFGFGLGFSGMTSPAKVLNFLDITGNWDPTLMVVFGSALGTFAALWFFWLRKRKAAVCGNNMPKSCDSDPMSRRLVIGSALFGAGWGIGGFCPGPAIAGLAALVPDVAIFVVAMAVGMGIARTGLGADK